MNERWLAKQKRLKALGEEISDAEDEDDEEDEDDDDEDEVDWSYTIW